MKNRFGVAVRRLILLAAGYLLASCAAPDSAPQDPRLTGPRDGDLQRILATPRPPRVVATAGQPANFSPRATARLTTEALSEQRGARQVQIAAVPLLRSTVEGGAFLAMTGHRALAQGEPTASCPALSHAPPNAPDPVAAASVSLALCLSELKRRGAPESCGCRLIALDDALLAPLNRFAFAPAVSALLIDDGTATRLIAEAEIQNGTEIIRLRNAIGEIGTLRAQASGDDISGVINEKRYSGTRAPFGYRRGRLAERVTLTSTDGEPLSLLIGVERRDATPK